MTSYNKKLFKICGKCLLPVKKEELKNSIICLKCNNLYKIKKSINNNINDGKKICLDCKEYKNINSEIITGKTRCKKCYIKNKIEQDEEKRKINNSDHPIYYERLKRSEFKQNKKLKIEKDEQKRKKHNMNNTPKAEKEKKEKYILKIEIIKSKIQEIKQQPEPEGERERKEYFKRINKKEVLIKRYLGYINPEEQEEEEPPEENTE